MNEWHSVLHCRVVEYVVFALNAVCVHNVSCRNCHTNSDSPAIYVKQIPTSPLILLRSFYTTENSADPRKAPIPRLQLHLGSSHSLPAAS